MKNTVLIFLLILSSFVKSQNYRIFYHLDFVKDTLAHDHEKRNMVAWVNHDNFIFCSDELLKTDSAYSYDKKKIYVSPDEIEFMIMRNQTVTYQYHFINTQLYRVAEKFQPLNWEIKNKIKNIGGLTCQLATVEHAGRNWEAWFSKSHTTTFGPYVFHGLPGIIVELYDTKRHYTFSLQKIKNEDRKISESIFGGSNSDFQKPVTVTQNQLQKIYLAYYSDPYRILKEKGIIEMYDEKTGTAEPPPDFNILSKQKQKYIRKTNNPIELNKAVKYPMK